MPWLGAKLRATKLTNCAACWTNTSQANTKGAGDESHELAFPRRDAFAGMDAAALSVARHGCGGAGCGSDDGLRARLHALHGRRSCAASDARHAFRDLRFSFTIERRGAGAVFFSPTGGNNANLISRSERVSRILVRLNFAGRSALAGGSVAVGSGILQPALCRRIPASRTRAPQTIHNPEYSSACDVPNAAAAAWAGTGRSLLRVQMAAGAGGNRLVPPDRAVACVRSGGAFRGATGIGDCARTGAHPAARSFRECFPDCSGDAVVLSP